MPVLVNCTDHTRHQFQPLRKLILPRSRDQQPFLRPGHADVEEFHVLGGLGFQCFDLAEVDGQKTQGARLESGREEGGLTN